MSATTAALLGTIFSGLVSLLVASVQHSKSMALMEYRLKELEAKVDKHNNLVERMYIVETKLKLVQRKEGSDG